MHLNEEQVQRWLHGELDASSKEALSRHVAACESCALRIDEAGREEKAIFDLLGHVDHPAPRVGPETIARGGVFSTAWGRRVAGFVIAVALAGAAYAVPGSPLPALLKQVGGWITGRTPTPPAPTAIEEAPPGPSPVTSGIAVPASRRFAIHFAAEQTLGVVTLSLTDGPNVVVRVLGGTVAFTTDLDRLSVENSGAAVDYEVELPRSAPWVEVFVGGRRVVLKDGDRFVADAPADARGRYILPLAPPPPAEH
jgi:anti-sigma factor RsiW